MATRLFVYGTLMPGHLRWPMLEPVALGPVIAGWALGTLYDTGLGWPSARFDRATPDCGGASTRVPGYIVDLAEPCDDFWRTLDHMEGIAVPPDPPRDPYERVQIQVVTLDGGSVVAWSYHADRVETSWEPIDEWRGRAER